MQRWEYCELRLDISQGVMHKECISFERADGPCEQVPITGRAHAIAPLGQEGGGALGTAGSLMSEAGGLPVFPKRPIADDESDA
jgi:hypothetical protein